MQREVMKSLSKEADLFCTRKASHHVGMIRIPVGKTSVGPISEEVMWCTASPFLSLEPF